MLPCTAEFIRLIKLAVIDIAQDGGVICASASQVNQPAFFTRTSRTFLSFYFIAAGPRKGT